MQVPIPRRTVLSRQNSRSSPFGEDYSLCREDSPSLDSPRIEERTITVLKCEQCVRFKNETILRPSEMTDRKNAEEIADFVLDKIINDPRAGKWQDQIVDKVSCSVKKLEPDIPIHLHEKLLYFGKGLLTGSVVTGCLLWAFRMYLTKK